MTANSRSILLAAVAHIVLFSLWHTAALADDGAFASIDHSSPDSIAVSDEHSRNLESVNVQCLTRTGRYWGNHPDVLGYFLTSSCGFEFLNSAQAIEDICFSGRDYKNNNTSAEQLQLIRQCAVANLNLEASELCEPRVVERVIECCNDRGSVCNSGATSEEIHASGCIDDLEAFNRSADTIDEVPWQFAAYGGADRSVCKLKSGDGIVNIGRNLGPGR